MPRPDPWRLDPARYPHRRTIQTRFQDLDPLGHLNNVAYAALFETSRIHFNHAIGLLRWQRFRWLVANVEINYLDEGQFPADVEIATGIGPIGARSWRILAVMVQDDRALATCDVVLVASRDSAQHGLPADMRAALEAARVDASGQP